MAILVTRIKSKLRAAAKLGKQKGVSSIKYQAMLLPCSTTLSTEVNANARFLE